MNWGVVIAAGGLEKEPLAASLGTPRKALAVFGGRTSLARTLDAVRNAKFEHCVTVSGEDVRGEVHYGDLVLECGSAIDNARIGIEALLAQGDEPADAILFLPADTPLLTGDMLRRFADYVEMRLSQTPSERWYCTGFCPTPEFVSTYPNVPVQSIQLRGGPMVSGALYGCTPEGFMHGIDLFKQVRESRKNQLAMVWKFGLWNVLRYFLHRVSIKDAERVVGRVLGGLVIIDPSCDPETCLDYDDEAELAALRAIAG